MYFTLRIITPIGERFNEEVTAVTAPASRGYLGVLANHAPMMSGLQPGVVTVDSDDGPRYFAIRDGVLEVQRNNVEILCDRAEEKESLEAAKALVAEYTKPPPKAE